MVTNFYDAGNNTGYGRNPTGNNNWSDIAKNSAANSKVEDAKKTFKEGCSKWFKSVAIGAAALATWYVLTTPPKEERMLPVSEKYALPTEITVQETTLPKHQRTNPEGKLEYYINTADIAKNEKFMIKTDKYTVEKDKDDGFFRAIGYVFSLPRRALFWDYDVSKGPDAERTNAIISMLENDTVLKGITVRVGYNASFKDIGRLFKDEKVKERNGFLARLLVGLPGTIAGSLMAELSKNDYYNPMTQTAMVYSNIESIAAHEMGHFQDFHRYDRDWIYQLFRVTTPVMIFQEAKASLYAKDIMGDKDRWQFERYLIPAFVMSALYGINQTRSRFRKAKKKLQEK